LQRDIGPESTVVLPKFKSEGCSVLIDRLDQSYIAVEEELRAEGKEALPQAFEWAREDMVSAGAALKDALIPTAPADTTARQEANKILDERWGGFKGWHGAMLTLPQAAIVDYDMMSTLYETLYAEGLDFLAFAYDIQFKASESRLQAIEKGGYQAAIEANGGGVHLKMLKEAHEAFGQALGISTELTVESSPNLSNAFLEARNTIRWYVARVACWPDRRAPERAALAERLLSPLTNYGETATAEPKETTEDTNTSKD